MPSAKPIEYDVETTGFQAYSGHYPFLFQFYDGKEAVAYPWDPDGGREGKRYHDEIDRWLRRADDEGLRAWNTKFDLHFGQTQGFTLPPEEKWRDGMLTAHAIDERIPSKLKSRAVALFGEGADDREKEVKAWLTKERARRKKEAEAANADLVEPNYSDVPMDIMEPYALEDVLLTRRVCDAYEPQVTGDIKRTVEFEHDVLPALYNIERRGIPADADAYRKLEQECARKLEALSDRAEELMREGGIDEPNIQSSKQVIAALKGRGANMDFMEKSGGEVASANRENLEACDDPLSQAILEFRTEYKVLSTYVRPMVGRHRDTGTRTWQEPYVAPDGRVHATYLQIGARTGRMSCLNPNMQNQPRDDLRLRWCMRAEEGHKLVCVDLSNIEMVLFAMFAGNGNLMRTIKEGGDLHALTAAKLGIEDRVRTGGSIESARQRAKALNFAIVYGVGFKGIMRQQRVTHDRARKMKQDWFRLYPEAKALMNRVSNKLHQDGYVQDHFISGRRFRCRDAHKEDYKFTNYLVQGTAASVLKEAVAKLHKDGVPMVALVHDEVVAHVPEADAREVGNLIQQRLTENDEIKQYVPLKADIDIVDRWSDAKPLKDGSFFVPEFAR